MGWKVCCWLQYIWWDDFVPWRRKELVVVTSVQSKLKAHRWNFLLFSLDQILSIDSDIWFMAELNPSNMGYLCYLNMNKSSDPLDISLHLIYNSKIILYFLNHHQSTLLEKSQFWAVKQLWSICNLAQILWIGIKIIETLCFNLVNGRKIYV